VNQYNLSFIYDEDLFNHVKETIEQYSLKMDLKKFNSNLIDPIKLTFNAEIVRQLDKSNSNVLGLFSTELL